MRSWLAKRNLTRLISGVVLTTVVAIGGTGCAGDTSDLRTPHQLTVRVRSAAGDAVTNFEVTAWIIDTDQAGDSRQPIALEPLLTDSQGDAAWTYEALLTPYICGFEVRNTVGDVVADQPPHVTQRMTTDSGILTLTL